MSVFHNNILAGASGASGGAAAAFKIDRSLRFNSDDDTYLFFDPSGHGNRKVFTFSFWVKRAKLGTVQLVLYIRSGAGNTGRVMFDASDRLEVESEISGSSVAKKVTSAVFRDCSAWQHFVVKFDAVNTNCDIYHNGVELTDFDTDTEPTNVDHYFGGDFQHYLGGFADSSTVDGYLAEVHMVNGQALAATDFGEPDDDGVWQPKDYSGSHGTNGFHLKFADNSSNAALGTDSSGNSNTFTVYNLSIGTSYPFSAEFDGSTSQYIRKAGSGVLPGNGDGSFTVECHFLPRTNSVKGLFDGGSGETNIIRNYDANEIGKQAGPTVDISGDYTVNDWNHMAACYNGSTDTLNVFINGTSSGTCSFSSYNGGNNFDIGTINTGGDGKFNGLIRNFRVTNNVVYSSNFTAPSHTSNLTNISGTQLLLFTTDANGLLTDGSSVGHTLTNNGGVSPYIPGADNDSLIDTPTNYTADSGNNGGNYATLNPLDSSSDITLSNGNLDETTSTSGHRMTSGTIAVNSGKWYVEVTVTSLGGTYSHVGITPVNTSNTTFVGNNGYGYTHAGTKQGLNASSASYGNSYAAGDCIGIAFDADNGNLYFYKNGVAQNSGTAAFTGIDTSKHWRFSISHFNGGGAIVNFGQRSFKYTNAGTNRPAATYLSLCTQNFADPTIADGSTAMNVKTWSGDSTERAITGYNFSPDFVWIRTRSVGEEHVLSDIVRGAGKVMSSSADNKESDFSDPGHWGYVKSFDSDGFTVDNGAGGYHRVNSSGRTYVGWAWDGGTSTASNTDGSITSSVRANTSAGFSICTYTGSTGNQSFGHGLNDAPKFIAIKNRSSAANWFVMIDIGTTYYKYGHLNTTASFADATAQPVSSTTVTLGNNNAWFGANGDNYVAYCWAAVEGYSAFGSYEGNGNANGPFVYTGMRPRWILLKNADSGAGGYDWVLYDTERDTYNVGYQFLCPNATTKELRRASDSADKTDRYIDILSNGFKLRNSNANYNANGETFVYAAFAEHPFKTARAR